MKGSKQLFAILVLLFGTLAAAHDMGSMRKGPKKNDGLDDVFMGLSADEYWARVKGNDFEFTGKVRKYYISSDEVYWDYAPQGHNVVNGSEFQGLAYEFIAQAPDRLGTTFKKCLYREYTDETFTKLKPKTQDELHRGFLGPAIYAEVGDAIVVKYRNKCRFPTSMHPHTLFYSKANEGALYNDTTTPGENKADDGVQPGDFHVYKWIVNERSGPGPMDHSSIIATYHSHVDLNADFYAGLVGTITITRKGMAKKDGKPKDVDRHMFSLYSVGDESQNPYLEDNFQRFSTAPPGTPRPTDGGFTGSLSKFAINGYIFGNGNIPTFTQYEQVRWCTFSLGNRDAHTPHKHGNTFLASGMRMDVTSIMPGEIVCIDMKPDDVGYWLFHCHVGAHLDEGMVSRFHVLPAKVDKNDFLREEDNYKKTHSKEEIPEY